MEDMIDLSAATLTPNRSADWPITAAITRIDLMPGGVHIEFTRKDGPDRWPDVVPEGWDGPVQFTIWFGARLGDGWHVAASYNAWYGLDNFGGPVSDPAHIRGDLWYLDGALAGHTPAVGEDIAIFITAGGDRGIDAHAVNERSNVVTVKMPGQEGGTFMFSETPTEDRAGLVAQVKADLMARGVALDGPCGAFEITKRVAWKLRPNFGLVAKPSGNNCQGFSVDGVMDRAGNFFDILIGSGDDNGPNWMQNGTVDVSRFVDAPDPGDDVVIPPAPPVDPPVPPAPPVPADPIPHQMLLDQITLCRKDVQNGSEQIMGRLSQIVEDAEATLKKVLPFLPFLSKATARPDAVEAPTLDDAAEALWIVLANVSGGAWGQQTEEWQAAARSARDNYFAATRK